MNNYNELIKHDNERFQIKTFSNFLTKNEHDLKMHYHDNLEIIHVLNGETEYVINGYRYLAKKNSFIIINPNQVHQAQVLTDDKVNNNVVMFNYSLLTSRVIDMSDELYISPLKNNKIVLFNIINEEDEHYTHLHDVFYGVRSLLDKKEYGFELLIKSKLFSLIGYFMSNNLYYKNLAYKRKKEIESQDPIRMVIEFIHDEYSNDISLNDISDAVQVSKFHLCRNFKENTGVTINKYLNDYRLFIASKELKDTNKDINSIAYDVGFSSPSYFISKFKEMYITTPSKYRKQIKSDSQ